LTFERRVVRLFKRLGKWNVKHDVTLIDKNGNRSQIDIVYGLFFKTYVECKNYTNPVPLKDVAKFKEVLIMNGISPRRGLFITSSTFVPRATTIGIKCWDGNELRRRERMVRRKIVWTRIFTIVIVIGFVFVLVEPELA